MPPDSPPQHSFIPVEGESHFPIQNLPYGVFRPSTGAVARVGVAIGEQVLDLSVLEERGLLDLAELNGRRVFDRPALNDFMAAGSAAWRQVRRRLTQLLSEDCTTLRDDATLREAAFTPRDRVEMLLPAEIGDYTDFYSSREHATNVGTMMRGADNALQPNWLHLPVAYHARASSVVISGTDIPRPCGQTMTEGAGEPRFGPTRALDFELEMGFFIGPGNPLGNRAPVSSAGEHIFGLVLVNDWSARDVQKWEYLPLGPFLSKNFATSISPWVVTLEALEPFRVAGPRQEPEPLEYLKTQGDQTYDIRLEVTLNTPTLTQPHRICTSNFRYLYWNMRQQLAHHTATGCNLRPGDLLASGTISGPAPQERGCLLERTWRGEQPIELPDGSVRRFLEDGDQVTITGWCQAENHRVGFGEATGRVLPARPLPDAKETA